MLNCRWVKFMPSTHSYSKKTRLNKKISSLTDWRMPLYTLDCALLFRPLRFVKRIMRLWMLLFISTFETSFKNYKVKVYFSRPKETPNIIYRGFQFSCTCPFLQCSPIAAPFAEYYNSWSWNQNDPSTQGPNSTKLDITFWLFRKIQC